MLKIEKTVLPSPEQWEIIIEGMRNPMNSWDRMDSSFIDEFCLGANDRNLMCGLARGGAVHAKYRRMIPVFLTINAPLYWWKEMDRYRVGVEMNSCSTMHKIHAKEFTLSDFSHEHLGKFERGVLKYLIEALNRARDCFLEAKEKEHWWQMIQLLPSSYNQKRTVMLNYEVLVNIYHSRKNHKLDEWRNFCEWIRGLPHSEMITGEYDD